MPSRTVSRPKFRFLLVLSISLIALLAQHGLLPTDSLALDDLFATPTGTDVVCSQSDPCDLPTAVLLAADNQVVYAAGGTYTRPVDPVLSIDKDVRLTGGWDGAGSGPVVVDPVANPTVLDGEDVRRVIEVTDLATPIIKGVTVKRGYHTIKGGGIYIDDSPLVQVHDTIFHANTTGSYAGALYINEGTVEIKSCRFEANEATNGGGALMLGNGSNATVVDNTFTGNTASYGSALHSDKASLMFYNNHVLANLGTSSSTALSFTGTVGHVINLFNNIVAGNVGTGIKARGYTLNLFHNTLSDNGGDGLILIFDAHAVLRNNIFSGHDGTWAESIVVDSTGVIDSSSNNLFWNNTSDLYTGTDPVLADPAFRGTYHLRSGSAARDAGTDASIHWDIDHQARPRGGAPDIGADEFYPEVQPAPVLLLLN